MCRLSWNPGGSTSWNPQGLSRPVMGLLYLFINLDTRYKWVVTSLLGRYAQQKEPLYLYPLDMKVCGTRRLSGRVWRKKTPLFFILIFAATVLLGPTPFHSLSSAITFIGHITVRTTPLDEWSARRRGLYLTTHNIHKTELSMPPPAEFEPAIPGRDRPQIHSLDRAVTEINGNISFPAAIWTRISRCPVLSMVTILTEITQLA